jgi:hypothetical protein
MVKKCGLARHSDFKRQFEVRWRPSSRKVAAFGLTVADTMPYNRAVQLKGQTCVG